MGRYRIEQLGETQFDPTGREAARRIDRRLPDFDQLPSLYHASEEDLERFMGHVFKPHRLISNGQLRRIRYQRKIAESKEI